MYKFHKKNVPEIFTSFFQCNSSVHGYSTRQREYLHVPPVKNNLSQFSIRYRGVVVWNAILKSKINPDVSEFVFVKSFKVHIIDKKIRSIIIKISKSMHVLRVNSHYNVYVNLSIAPDVSGTCYYRMGRVALAAIARDLYSLQYLVILHMSFINM